MSQTLSPAQRKLHNKALNACATHRRMETVIIQSLIDIEPQNIHCLLEHSSLHAYAVDSLGLSNANAYSFIGVARKCRECAPLRVVIEKRSLTVSKAARLVSVISNENAEELLKFATTHTSRQIDKEVARLSPRNKVKDRVKPLSPEWEQLNCAVSPQVSTLLKRAQSVLSSQQGRSADFNETLLVSLNAFLDKHDPVRKAERAHKRKSATAESAQAGKQTTAACAQERKQAPAESAQAKYQAPADKSVCVGRASNEKKRVPLTASEKHAVHGRDEGRCTFVHPVTGKRCENDRWLHIHHVLAVAEGGGNDPDNLRTLCAAHHDLVHQLSLPIDGQVSWLREPQARYG